MLQLRENSSAYFNMHTYSKLSDHFYVCVCIDEFPGPLPTGSQVNLLLLCLISVTKQRSSLTANIWRGLMIMATAVYVITTLIFKMRDH